MRIRQGSKSLFERGNLIQKDHLRVAGFEVIGDSLGAIVMDQRLFEHVVFGAEQGHRRVTESAEGLIVPLLFCGVIGGFLLARWIFRGGLSRAGLVQENTVERIDAAGSAGVE